MKNHLLLLVILTSLSVSCTSEDLNTPEIKDSTLMKEKFKKTEKLFQNLDAENPSYPATERKDKDWETSVGNRIGTKHGVVDNSSKAISKPIMTEHLIQNGQTE